MIVTVEFLDILREIVGNRSVEVDIQGSTLEALMGHLCHTYGNRFRNQVYPPREGDLLSSIIFIINGRVIGSGSKPGILSTPIKASDIVCIMHAMSGG